MKLWYDFWAFMPFDLFHWDFMCNALLAVLLMAPLFGLCSTMIVTGRMSFFSDALGHSAFTGIAIGCICGFGEPTWVAVLFAVASLLPLAATALRNTIATSLVTSYPSPPASWACWQWF